MGSNGLDWKNVGIRSYSAGNKGVRVERSLGEAGMQSEPGTRHQRRGSCPDLRRGDQRARPGSTRRPRSNRPPAARGSSGPPLEVGNGRRVRPALRCLPSPPLTIFLPVVSGPLPSDLLGPFKKGSAATSLPASAGARLNLPHLTTRPPWPARDRGRREARPKIQRNADAGASCAC